MSSEKSLPRFQKRHFDHVRAFMLEVLTNHSAEESNLRDLIFFEDGHFRAVFGSGYFSGDTPSKSQWNNLKKKLKRHDRTVFVFKEHGSVPCPDSDSATCYYLDFGFFAS